MKLGEIQIRDNSGYVFEVATGEVPRLHAHFRIIGCLFAFICIGLEITSPLHNEAGIQVTVLEHLLHTGG